MHILGDPEVTAKIYTANHATFLIRIRNITVQIYVLGILVDLFINSFLLLPGSLSKLDFFIDLHISSFNPNSIGGGGGDQTMRRKI